MINMPLSPSTRKITTEWDKKKTQTVTTPKTFKKPETPHAPKKRPREELEQEIQLLREKLQQKKTKRSKRSEPMQRLNDFICNNYKQELQQWEQNKNPNKKNARPAGIRIRAFLKRTLVTKQRFNEFKAFGTILNGASNQRSMSAICEETCMPPNVIHFLQRMINEHKQICQLREQLEDAADNFHTSYDEFSEAVKQAQQDAAECQ